MQEAHLDGQSGRLIVIDEDLHVSVWGGDGARLDDGGRADTRLLELPVTPDGRIVVTGKDAVRFLDARTGRPLPQTIEQSYVTCVDISPDGRTLAMGSVRGEVSIADLGSSAITRSWQVTDGVITAVRFAPDGTLLATSGMDRIVRLWETASGRLFAAAPPFPSAPFLLRFSPDGRRLAIAGGASQAWLWDVSPDRGDAERLARRSRCVSPFRLEGTALVAAEADPAACGR